MKGVFLLEDIDFGVKHLANGKCKDIEDCQVKILKIGGSILIPHIHKLFNLAVNQWFPTPWTQCLIIPIFKSGNKNDPSNYWTIMISPLLAMLYGIIFEKEINEWLKTEGKRDKCQACFRRNHSTTYHLLTLRIISEESRNNKYDLFFFLWILEKLLIQCLEITCVIS